MAYPIGEIAGPAKRRIRLVVIVIAVVIFLGLLRVLAGYTIDFQWWKEMGQLRTWFSMLAYTVVPPAIATIIGFILLWVAHARALKFAGTGLGKHRWYARISTLAIFVVALLIGIATTDTWTVVRYFGGLGVGGEITNHGPGKIGRAHV